jgi:hypothetical protein
MTGADLDRLVDRWAINREYADVVERHQERAQRDAEWMTRPRVRVVDRERRIVRVTNAPAEAVKSPPGTLTYARWDPVDGHTSFEPVAKLVGSPMRLDLDYEVIEGTRAAREFFAVLEDIEPSVTVETGPSGRVRMITDLGA